MSKKRPFAVREFLPWARKLMLRSWRPLTALTLLVWFCGAVVFWPIISFCLHKLAFYEDVIVGNYTIHLWLLTPRGFTWLLLMVSTTLLSWTVYAAGIFLVLTRAANLGFREGLKTFLQSIRQVGGLFRLSLGALVLLLPLLLLAAVGPGLTYLLLLRDHDINYYLFHQPPEWFVAIAMGTAWIVSWAVLLVNIVVRFVFVYPCWLDGSGSFRAAFRDSWRLTRRVRAPLLRLFVYGVALWGAVVVASDALSHLLTVGLLHLFARSIHSAVYILSGHLILSGFLDAAFFFCITAWFVSTVFLCYRRVHLSDDGFAAEQGAGNPDDSAKRFPWLKPILLFLLTIGVASWGLSHWYLLQDVPDTVPLVIAHRAGAADAPENSMAGLRKVLRDDIADIFEIDVQSTADDVLVVAHDKDLMKSADDPRIIGESTYKELRKVNIGKTFGPGFKRERLRTLDDFLKASRRKMPLIVEFKFAAQTNMVDRTIKLIQKRKMESQVILMSLELEDVRRVQEIAPDIKNGYFVSVEIGDLSVLDVDVIALKDGVETPRLIEDLHAAGMEVYSWTIDDPNRMVELMAMGVDGLITNDPALCAEVVRRYSKLTSEQRVLLRFKGFWDILKRLDIWGSV